MKRTVPNIQHKTAYFVFDMPLTEQSYLDTHYYNLLRIVHT